MRTIVKFVLPAVASLALAACGSSGSSSSSSQASAPTSSRSSQAAASAESAGAVVKTASDPALHATVLVNSQGMTLYHLTGETTSHLICTSTACVQAWHPVTVTAAVTPSGSVSGLSTVKRPDGTTQVTYKGEPLYTFEGDKQAGEAKGQGLKDVGTWTVITTGAGATSKESESQPAPAAPASAAGAESSGAGASESSGSGGSGGSGGYSY
jgi:predicted lipoprotein with Yx(FWY)xxD motif